MKRLFFFTLLILFVGIGCSDKKNTQTTLDKKNAEITNTDSVENKQIIEFGAEVVQIVDEQINDSNYYKWYNKFREENNSKLSYCDTVIICTDTIFFTINDVNKNGPNNYILSYGMARKLLKEENPNPLYSVAVMFEKNNILAITVWEQGDCEWYDRLVTIKKTTGKCLANTIIASNGCGDADITNIITIKDDSLFVYNTIYCYHPEIGYLYDRYKTCFIVNDYGDIETKKILSASDTFKKGKVNFNDESVMRFFELMSLIPDDCLEKCGINWNDSDRKSMLYNNIKYDGRLIKSHPEMRSINYSNYNLEVDLGKTVSNFHLYKTEDEREFLVISTVDSSTMNGCFTAYQYKDSAFVELVDFFPAQPSQTATTFKSYLFDGDTLTQSYVNTYSNQTDTRKYVFDKAKGVLVGDGHQR